MAQHPELRRIGYKLPANAPIAVSYGMGVDSTAILVRFAREGIRPDMVIFADTGCEKDVTYRFLGSVRAWMAVVWPGLDLTVLPYSNAEGCLQTLVQYLLRTEQLPGTAYGTRSCSTKYKGGRIDALVDRTYGDRLEYYRNGGQVIRVLGYDAGPADRERREKDLRTQEAKRALYGEEILPGSKARYRASITERVQKIRQDWSFSTFYVLDPTHMDLSPDERRALDPGRMSRLTPAKLEKLLDAEDDESFEMLQRLAARGGVERPGKRDNVLVERKAWIARPHLVPVSAAEKYVWWYPLYDWAWDREQCIAEIESTKEPGSPVPQLEVPPKSACYICSSNKTFETLSFVMCEPDEAYNILLIEALGLAPDEEQLYACTSDECDWEGPLSEAEEKDGKNVCPLCGAKIKKAQKKVSEGIWRQAASGAAGGIAAPASMSEYILEWMRDGRAYDLLPPGPRGAHGLTLREMARLPHVGRVYLPVLQNQPRDPEALAELRKRGTAIADAIHERAQRDGLLVSGRAVRLDDPDSTRRRVADAARRVRRKLYGEKVCGAPLPERYRLRAQTDEACEGVTSCSDDRECEVRPLPPGPPAAPTASLPTPSLGAPRPSPALAPPPPVAASGTARYVPYHGLFWMVMDRQLGIMMPGTYATEAAAQAEADRRNRG